MVRLALVDLSERGQQPIWSPDGLVAILFNGEMYNFRSERTRLERGGYLFRSSTDTEVALALYLERGSAFVQTVRGMFALAILDWRGGGRDAPPSLFLARDRFGIKPLWVAEGQGTIAFASELHAIRRSGVISGEIDENGLACFLEHGFVLQPGSILRGARMLEAGTWELFEDGHPTRRERFPPTKAPQRLQEPFQETARRLRVVLEESVALHALADAPIGAFLSGGVDSSAIVALMRPHVSKLHTYSLGWDDGGAPDETRQAEATARRFSCDHTTHVVSGRAVADLLPLFARDLDQPSSDGLNTWFVSRVAARDVKGVLSGLGGDEWFAGYPVASGMAAYASPWRATALRSMGYAAQAFSRWMPAGSARQRMRNLSWYRSPLALWTRSHTVFPPEEASALVGLPLVSTSEGKIAASLALWDEGVDLTSPVALAARLDSEVYMRSQLLRDSDAASMAHSLELRVPLVDAEIAGFASTCPDGYKLSLPALNGASSARSGTKQILIEALRDILPPDIHNRPKLGFAMPYEMWLRGPLLEIAMETTNEASIARRGLLDNRAVTRVREAFRNGESGAGYPKLWSVMILELWMHRMSDGAFDGAANGDPAWGAENQTSGLNSSRSHETGS